MYHHHHTAYLDRFSKAAGKFKEKQAQIGGGGAEAASGAAAAASASSAKKAAAPTAADLAKAEDLKAQGMYIVGRYVDMYVGKIPAGPISIA